MKEFKSAYLYKDIYYGKKGDFRRKISPAINSFSIYDEEIIILLSLNVI